MIRANSITGDVPLLGVPERLGPFERSKALWVAAGFLAVPQYIGLAAIFDRHSYLIFGNLLLYPIWFVLIAFSLLMAFFRPGGLNAGQWITALIIYAVEPKHAAYWRH